MSKSLSSNTNGKITEVKTFALLGNKAPPLLRGLMIPVQLMKKAKIKPHQGWKVLNILQGDDLEILNLETKNREILTAKQWGQL